MRSETIHIYVGDPSHRPNYTTITEAIHAVSAGYIAPEPVFPAPREILAPAVIHIAPGIYREKLVLERPYVTLEGTAAEDTALIYGNYANELLENGEKRGTFRTASVRIHTHDVACKNLTFQNDAGCGRAVGQALALYVDGDRISFRSCRMLGSQDTLFTAPLPLKEAQPGGFKGPGEFLPRTPGRHYFLDCFLQGDVDFLFGGGICYFDRCTIFSKKPEILPRPEPDGTVICGYITAASTFEGEPYGYVLESCRLLSDCPDGSVYLGRPWREFAKTVYLNCEMGPHIHPAGWTDWKKPHGHFYFGEYRSFGPGASPSTRTDYSHQLTDAEAAEYTPEKVLQGWIPE